MNEVHRFRSVPGRSAGSDGSNRSRRGSAAARAVALDDQVIAVVLDFVDPVRPSRNFGSARRETRFERSFTHGGLDRERRKCESAPAPPIGACSPAI
jgi:hypothetical protein